MPKQSYILNNNAVNYLIHGDLFSYKYVIPAAWFVIIKYESELAHNYERLKWWKKKYYLRKNKGIFENHTNAYSPKIEFYCFGYSFWKITKNFKVNFVNVKLPDFEIKDMTLKKHTLYQLKKPLLHFEINKTIISRIFCHKNTFSIVNNKLKIMDSNDFEQFKQQYKPH